MRELQDLARDLVFQLWVVARALGDDADEVRACRRAAEDEPFR